MRKSWLKGRWMVVIAALLALGALTAILPSAASAVRSPQSVSLDGGALWTPPTPSSNGESVTVMPGASIEVTFTVAVETASWKSTSWQVGPVSGCADHGDHSSGLEWTDFTETFFITAPSVAGKYDLTLQAWGAQDDCTGSGAGPNNPITLSNAVIVYDRFVSGGGQLVEEDNKRPDWHVISFGGFAASAGASGLIGEWQVNFHNVGVDGLDKSSFHTTSIDAMNFYVRDCGIAMNFYATGMWNGIPGYKMIFRAQDAGEPGNLDNARIELYAPGGVKVYDTYWSGEFTAESDCVGTARTGLDHGNLQMAVLTP